jgi:hypothetical protein
VDLLTLKDLSTNRRSAELWKLVAERQRLFGLAWLTDVGHKRPDTPKGIPLEEAQKKAAELEKQIRKLAEPAKITLTLHFLYRGKEPVSLPARSAREGKTLAFFGRSSPRSVRTSRINCPRNSNPASTSPA